MGRGDIGEVEGRILAQQHDVHFGEIDCMGLAEVEMVALRCRAPRACARRPRRRSRRQRELVGRVVEELRPRFCASSSRAKVESPAILMLSIGSIWTAIFLALLILSFCSGVCWYWPKWTFGSSEAETDSRQDNASNEKTIESRQKTAAYFHILLWIGRAGQSKVVPDPFGLQHGDAIGFFEPRISFRLWRRDEYGLPHCRKSERRAIAGTAIIGRGAACVAILAEIIGDCRIAKAIIHLSPSRSKTCSGWALRPCALPGQDCIGRRSFYCAFAGRRP